MNTSENLCIHLLRKTECKKGEWGYRMNTLKNTVDEV
jgi:hypothetical protein